MMTHHWRKKDKKNPEFIAKYPYAASHAALVEHFVNKHNHDHGLKHRVLVFDSAFTTCDLFRMLMRKGNDAVGSVKFPFAGVPQSLLWSKKRVNKRGGPAVFPGDCYHIRSVTDDRTLGVQQVMVRGGTPAASFSVSLHAWHWPHNVSSHRPLVACCYLQDNTVVTFLTTIHTVYSGKRADLEAKYGTRWHVATRKRPSADGSRVREQVLQPPAQRFYNYYYDGEFC